MRSGWDAVGLQVRRMLQESRRQAQQGETEDQAAVCSRSTPHWRAFVPAATATAHAVLTAKAAEPAAAL